ncbi:uncharacterized protein LOC117289165 [Asterias rubens]|uniref:uncharacterized protein LOC117289165 n=1 Tax=Asterias rubens TaxID=7604 RepID=UPI001455DAD6|nr:uncharacterized protein LOC117289165 [Asterias rubens]
MWFRGSFPPMTWAWFVLFAVLVAFAPGTMQQTSGVATLDLCQPNRVLPSYLQNACDQLLASMGTATSAMSDSGTRASPPDRRPLSDPPRYGRRNGGPPMTVHVSKRLYSLPTYKLFNGLRRRSGHHRLLDTNQSVNLLRRFASLINKFSLLENI